MAVKISASAFGVAPENPDNSAALARALLALRGKQGATLVIEPGRYSVRSPRATEVWTAISNHDNGFPRRAALAVEGHRDLTILGHGATIVSHGHVLPLFIRQSWGIAVEGLTIDAHTALHGWGHVLGAWSGGVEVQITGGHPWRVRNERLQFGVDGNWEDMWGAYEIDPSDLRPSAGSGDHCGCAWGVPWVCEERGGDRVYFRVHLPSPPETGQWLVLRHGLRVAPGITAIETDHLSLRQVTVHQASGMGVLAQRCRHPRLEKVRLEPAPGRLFSINNDATHFVHCAGHIEVEDCLFDRQLDDALNAHGVYARIDERAGQRLLARLVHAQQRGNVVASPGERMAVVDGETLLTVAEAEVESCHHLNPEFAEVVLRGPLPERVGPGFALHNLTWDPALTIRRCRITDNRARGILIQVAGPALVEQCHFRTSGSAILVGGEARFWFESGPVGQLTIRGNRFDHCGYGQFPGWGMAAIRVHPEMPCLAGPYHGHILVEDNRFEGCYGPLVEARAATKIEIVRNQVEAHRGQGALFQADHCGSLTEINTVRP